MSIHITQIGKHRFICGLFWQSLSRPRELAKEAAELAKKIDSDLMILRKDHATAQAGFAHTRDGARRMMYSLGAVVSKTIALEGAHYDGQKQPAHNWLGAFKLPDGLWAYFAVRDANFLPNGDFAGSKEAVLDRLHGDYGLGGWNVVIGDAELEDYGFHNFNVKSIEELIPRKKDGQIKTYRWWKLLAVEKQSSRAQLLLIAIVTLILIGGTGYAWRQYQFNKEQKLQAEAIAAAQQRLLGKGGAATLPHPWRSQPLPYLTVAACLQKFVHRVAGGWQLVDYSCTNSSVNYSWSRQDSTLEFLREQIPNAVIDMSGDKASLTESLQLADGGDEKLLALRELMEPTMARLQLMNIGLRVSKVAAPPVAPPQTTLPGAQEPQAPQADWQSYSFIVSAAGWSPGDIVTILSQPGIRINNLSYRNGEWSIEGNMYAKLP
jgi:hypothetical protein